MFGRGNRKSHRDARDAAAPDVLTESAEVTAAVRRVVAHIGCGYSPDGGNVLRLGVEDVDTSVTVETSPLALTLGAVWLGLPGEDVKDVRRVLNDWNGGHSVPRTWTAPDEDGDLRVLADTTMTCAAGVTAAQIDEWARRALAGLSELSDFLEGQWPDAEYMEADELDDAGDETEPEPTLSALQPVTLERIAEVIPGKTVTTSEDGASGRRGNGFVRPVGGNDAGADIALHERVMTVTAGAVFGEADADAVDWLRDVCTQASALPGGAVSVVDEAGAGDNAGVTVTCALHRPVGAGLADVQLVDAVSRDRETVERCFGELIAVITGDTDA
ncbi:MAG: YbjN domain-containing protein [Mycobacteriaceae bacterium]|uniref:YbjN domain-containing protein n=1 Tax=Corynebacterium sp. TaxID=1720 RepID=UPI003F9D5382